MAEAATNGPTQEMFEERLSEYTELKTASQRLAQKMKTCLGAYESAGGDPEEIKFAHRMAKLDKGEAQTKLRHMQRAAVWSGIVEWQADGQGDFAKTFNATARPKKTPATDKLAKARAVGDGYNSGKAGGPIGANPHGAKPGSEEFVWWRDGWEDGRADYILTHPEKADPPPAHDSGEPLPGKPAAPVH